MNTQKHTALPWKVSDNDTRVLENQPAFPGVRCVGTNELIADIFGTSDECKADAEFIVRACNSHDALVAALERIAKLCTEDYDERDPLGVVEAIANEAISAAKLSP